MGLDEKMCGVLSCDGSGAAGEGVIEVEIFANLWWQLERLVELRAVKRCCRGKKKKGR